MPAAQRAKAADLIRELETARALPEAAIRAAVMQADEIEPAVIALVEQAADGALLTPAQANPLLFGLPALAVARRTKVYRPLLRMLKRLSEDEIEWLFGDATTEYFVPIMLAVFDGDSTPLVEVVMDPSVDGWTRWTLLSVLARLTFDGVIERSLMLALLERFERENLAKADDPAWKGWQEAIILLGLEELRERIHATWADGRNPERKVDQEASDAALSAARAAAPGDATRFAEQFLAPLSDPLQTLSRWHWSNESDRTSNVDARQDNDPSLPVALDRDETDWMDRYLARRFGAADQAWEVIDGFYCALIVGPSGGDFREHIRVPLEIGEGPTFDTPEQAEYLTGLLTRHWTSIALRIASTSWHRPLLADADYPRGAVWAASFLRGVALRLQGWELQYRNQIVGVTIETLMTLAGRPNDRTRPLNARLRDELVAALPLALRSLYQIFQGLRDPLARAPLGADFNRKVGRNEPCPCGSGKKYKRCCASPDRGADG
jgi:yecA family protein